MNHPSHPILYNMGVETFLGWLYADGTGIACTFYTDSYAYIQYNDNIAYVDCNLEIFYRYITYTYIIIMHITMHSTPVPGVDNQPEKVCMTMSPLLLSI